MSIEKYLQTMLKEAIFFEQHMGELYNFFALIFPSDKKFWSVLAKEEMNHAALLEKTKTTIKSGAFPEELIHKNINELKKANAILMSTIVHYKKHRPTRAEAASFAYKLESSAYEIHFQFAMTKKSKSKFMQNLRLLNFFDKDHADRLTEYFNVNTKDSLKI